MELNKVSLLQAYLDFYYAKEISGKMHSVFKKKCFGCEHSCLSQTDHTCLSLTDEQQLELYFEDVLLDVNESDVLLKWSEAASALDVSPELLEMFKQKLFCKDWRETDMKTFSWKVKMIRMTVQLVHLEKNFTASQ